MDKSEDFSEFMWMENMEEFDREMEELIEEEDEALSVWNDIQNEDEAVSVLFEPDDWSLWMPQDDRTEDELSSSVDSTNSDLNPLADPFVPSSCERITV